MPKITLIVLLCLFGTTLCSAQIGPDWDLIQKNRQSSLKLTEQEKDVIKTILSLFDGMRAGDSSMVSSAFHKEVILHSQYTDGTGKARLREGSAQRFLTAVGTPHLEIWDEKLGNFDMKVDQNLAHIWTHYYFYLGDAFQHSGTNFFQLYKTLSGWEIYQLSDTRVRDLNPEKIKIKELW